MLEIWRVRFNSFHISQYTRSYSNWPWVCRICWFQNIHGFDCSSSNLLLTPVGQKQSDQSNGENIKKLDWAYRINGILPNERSTKSNFQYYADGFYTIYIYHNAKLHKFTLSIGMRIRLRIFWSPIVIRVGGGLYSSYIFRLFCQY